MATKQDIFDEHKEEYWQAGKRRKGEILDYITKTSRLRRESVIRRFQRMQKRSPVHQETRGRSVHYTKDVDAALFDLWEAANQPCGELLHPLINEYIDIFIRDGQWKHSDEATGKLRAMKEHTVRRRVSGFRKKHGSGKGRSTTKPSHLKAIIPIFKGPWNDLPPGHGQLDTVAHCGETLLGDFVFSLNYTDVATYWVIPRAQWNKGQEATKESVVMIRARLPFPLLGLHPDSGGEFITWLLKGWCDEHGIALSRSEPYKKNDNMYVEERNGHVVRKYLGYVRFDCRDVVPLINEIYDVLALYLNHFQTVRRTETKKRVGAKYIRTYEKLPKTPYRRVLEHEAIQHEAKERLRIEHEALNPLVLKRKIDTLTKKIMQKQRNYTRGK